MSDQLLALLTYASQRHPLTWRSVFEVGGLLGALGLGGAWSYVVFYTLFG